MKKIVMLMFCLGLVQVLHAQTMTDEQVKTHVLEAQSKGLSQQEIAKDLLVRGVTMDQINRIKRDMQNKEQDKASEVVADKLRMRTTSEPTLEIVPEEESNSEVVIFGHSIFRNRDVAFEASYNLPTPSDYKLGAGDQVAIDVWGASQSSLLKTISPDGNISIENLGPIYLSGLTVSQANALLKEKFESIYSGLNDENPTSNIRLSLAQNRAILVHVMGEVVNPGTYTMSSFSTIFNALYLSGGVNEKGSLRTIKVYRKDKPVANYDVYDFILNGKSNMGIRLEDNDVVVVDVCKNLVNIEGAVKRPMYYEFLEGETVGQVLDYAGGLSENAYKADVRIARSGKQEREILTIIKSDWDKVKLIDGDVLSVDVIAPTFSNMVEIKGAVYRPGTFQLSDNISTVKQLIECAGGLRDEAFLNRAILNRRNLNGTMENLAIDLRQLLGGSLADIPLKKNDVLLIHEWNEVYEMRTITVLGEVNFAGEYEFRDNMTIEDAVLGAGGLKEEASLVRVAVARRPKNAYAVAEIDTIAEVFELTLNDSLEVVGDPTFVLMPFDEVIVRRSPGYNYQEKVSVQGEILFPGSYVFSSKQTTLSQLVEMAGGCTSKAYPQSATLLRKKSEKEKELEKKAFKAALDAAQSKEDSLAIIKQEEENDEEEYSIAIDLAKAIEDPSSDANILLQEGDRLIIPRRIDVVRVSGEVMVPNVISYAEGKRLKHYIEMSGGFKEGAKKSKLYVVHPNGHVEKTKKWKRSVYPGSEIIVPAKKKREEGRMSSNQVIALSSAASSLATVVLTLVSVLK